MAINCIFFKVCQDFSFFIVSSGKNPPRHLAVDILGILPQKSQWDWRQGQKDSLAFVSVRKLGEPQEGTRTRDKDHSNSLPISLSLIPSFSLSGSSFLSLALLESMCLFHYLFSPSLPLKILGKGTYWVGQRLSWLPFCMVHPLPPTSHPLHWPQMHGLDD